MEALWLVAGGFTYLAIGMVIVGLIAGPAPISGKGYVLIALWPALAIAFVMLCIGLLCMYPAQRREKKLRAHRGRA